MLELSEFNQMDLDRKAEYIWKQDCFIASRIQDDFRINLYWVNGFYADIYYHVSDNRIHRIVAFCTETRLQPYLDLIELKL